MIAMGVAAVFDFLDGATARLLHKFSPYTAGHGAGNLAHEHLLAFGSADHNGAALVLCAGRCIQLSVFMSVLNVHANWFPVDGEVVHTAYE